MFFSVLSVVGAILFVGYVIDTAIKDTANNINNKLSDIRRAIENSGLGE